MKLRINSNSIRLRLTRDEVERLAHGEAIEEAIQFSVYDTFRYAIKPWLLDVTEAKFDGKILVIHVPEKTLAEWAASGQVGITVNQDNGSTDPLVILVEKDFACTGQGRGNDSNYFPNPDPRC